MAWNIERKLPSQTEWKAAGHGFATEQDAAEEVRRLERWSSFRYQYRLVPLAQPKPVPGLSPDMLSEEDRRMLRLLVSDAKAYWEGDIPHIARKWQFSWADRLLADNHGEG